MILIVYSYKTKIILFISNSFLRVVEVKIPSFIRFQKPFLTRKLVFFLVLNDDIYIYIYIYIYI